MKKTIIIIALTMCCQIKASAMTIQQDTIMDNSRRILTELYETIIPLLDRVEITGNSAASQELQKRWGWVMNYMKNNKDVLFNKVKKLMMTPSGRELNVETLRNFIDINQKDSTKKITINPDFILDELNILSEKLKEAGVKMAEKK